MARDHDHVGRSVSCVDMAEGPRSGEEHMETGSRRRYHVTVLGETITVEGPPDIVNMYRVVRGTYPPALSVELGSIDDESRLPQPDARRAPNKVHSHYGDK